MGNKQQKVLCCAGSCCATQGHAVLCCAVLCLFLLLNCGHTTASTDGSKPQAPSPRNVQHLVILTLQHIHNRQLPSQHAFSKLYGIPLPLLAVLFNLPLLLVEGAAGAFAARLGAALRPAEALRGRAAAGEGCAWLPQVGLRAAALRNDSSSRMQWATGSGVVAVRTCTGLCR